MSHIKTYYRSLERFIYLKKYMIETCNAGSISSIIVNNKYDIFKFGKYIWFQHIKLYEKKVKGCFTMLHCFTCWLLVTNSKMMSGYLVKYFKAKIKEHICVKTNKNYQCYKHRAQTFLGQKLYFFQSHIKVQTKPGADKKTIYFDCSKFLEIQYQLEILEL